MCAQGDVRSGSSSYMSPGEEAKHHTFTNTPQPLGVPKLQPGTTHVAVVGAAAVLLLDVHKAAAAAVCSC